MKICTLFIVLLCTSAAYAENCSAKKIIKEYRPKYAQFFSIRYYENFKLVTSGSGKEKDEFIVSESRPDCSTSLPVFSSNSKRFVATSTSHLPFLVYFGLEQRLVGFQGTSYISHKGLRSQKIKEINYQLNPEELVALAPDLVMAYTANVPGWKNIKHFRALKIPLVFNWDFYEKHPLARAEWIVFSSVFFGKDDLAQEFFTKIERSYMQTKTLASGLNKKSVLVGEMQNGKWVTCGGTSDLGLMIRDAGGKLYLDNDKTETQFLSLETALKVKSRPDVWLPQNNWQDTAAIRSDSRYAKFHGISVFNNNALINENGFNDYWETGLSRPDLLLKDLLFVFHSEKMPNHRPIWYKRLK